MREWGVRTIAKYTKLQQVGQGAYGEVWKGRCRETGTMVALKKIRIHNADEGFPRTAVREVKALRQLSHANIVRLVDVVTSTVDTSEDQDKAGSVFLVFEFSPYDLTGVVQSELALTADHARVYGFQVLAALQYMHTSGFLHRDLKSSNVLVNDDHTIKVADFGLSKVTGDSGKCRTSNVITLWYRPPELLLGVKEYGAGVDIWGAGCIIFELFSRRPVFQGATEAEVLAKILGICGSPTAASWPEFAALPGAKSLVLPSSTTGSMDKMFAKYNVPVPCRSLLRQMLNMDPKQRPSAEEAMRHPFFVECGLPTRPPVLPLLSSQLDATKGYHEMESKARRKAARGKPAAGAGDAVGATVEPPVAPSMPVTAPVVPVAAPPAARSTDDRRSQEDHRSRGDNGRRHSHRDDGHSRHHSRREDHRDDYKRHGGDHGSRRDRERDRDRDRDRHHRHHRDPRDRERHDRDRGRHERDRGHHERDRDDRRDHRDRDRRDRGSGRSGNRRDSRRRR